MKKIIFIIFALLYLVTVPCFAYDPIYVGGTTIPLVPSTGTIAGANDVTSTSATQLSAWKTTRIQITNSGTVTHFLIKIGPAPVGSVNIGFAVYDSTSPGTPPGTRRLIGYRSYTFSSGAGWYAIPFNSDATYNVTAGQYYHIAFYEQTEQNIFYRENPTVSEKWGSSQTANYNDPPDAGEWDISYISAPWVMGLLITELGYPNGVTASGTWTHKGSKTITGNEFGAKSPAAPLWWDDCEGASDGSTTFTSGDLAWVTTRLTAGNKHYAGAVNSSGSYSAANIHYRNVGYTPPSTSSAITGPHGNSKKYITGGHWQFAGDSPCYDCDDSDGYANVMLSVGDNVGTHDIWFASWYYRLTPEWSDVPYPYSEDHYSLRNHKIINLESGYGWYTSPFHYLSYAAPYIPETSAAEDIRIQSQDSGGCDAYKNELAGSNPKNDWVKYEMRYDSDVEIQEVYSNQTRCYYYDSPGICDLPGPKQGFSVGGWHALNPGGWANADNRGSQKNWRFFDDIYVDNTWSRVMLCKIDAETKSYANATICEPQIPSAWDGTSSPNSITVTVNQGALPDGKAYLFVFDSDNDSNPIGVEVLLGGGSTPQSVHGMTMGGGAHR